MEDTNYIEILTAKGCVMTTEETIVLRLLINQRCYVLAKYIDNKCDYDELEDAESKLERFIDSLLFVKSGKSTRSGK